MSDLKLFAGIHQALGRLCLVDGRARREIAEAAGINPSMLSGYCSGRLVPSLEHLDRLLVALKRRPEDLVEELRAVSEMQEAREENQIAVAALERMLDEVRQVILAEMYNLRKAKGPVQREQLAQLHAAADLLRPPSVKKAIEDVARVDARLRAEGERKGTKSPKRKEP